MGINREAFEVGFKGWDWSMGSIQDPWCAGFHPHAARTRTDAREAGFLIECLLIIVDSKL